MVEIEETKKDLLQEKGLILKVFFTNGTNNSTKITKEEKEKILESLEK